MTHASDNAKRKPAIIILIAILVLLIISLIASLLIRRQIIDGEGLIGLQPTEAVIETVTQVANTPTATKVVATTQPTETPTPTVTSPPPTTTPAPPTATPTAELLPLKVANLLQNSNFEQGIGNDGVALGWQAFQNGGAKVLFGAEGWPLAIDSGKYAQRITIFEASQPDRYAGIYQPITVVPGEPYKLTMRGQIRSKAGDIKVSQYGYRMQYAIDWQGGTDWQKIPADKWLELPWDEQLIDSAEVAFVDFETTIVPPARELTLFIRAWNKWADPVEAQYTLDSLSLVGAAPLEAMIDQPLPVSGGNLASQPPATDARFWASILILAFLLIITVRQMYKHQQTR